jgi:hypothetical protein
VLLYYGFGGGEIMGVVGAETQIGSSRGASCDCLQKIGLHEPVFVMTAFRPRIGKQHEDSLEDNLRRKCGDKLSGFGFEENEIGELGAIAFARGPFHAVAEQIEANAKLFWMRRRVIGEKMPMSRADFERDAWVCGEQICQLVLEFIAAGVAAGDEFGGAGWIVHAAVKHGDLPWCKPEFSGRVRCRC